MVVHTDNPNTLEGEAGESQFQGQLGLYRKTRHKIKHRSQPSSLYTRYYKLKTNGVNNFQMLGENLLSTWKITIRKDSKIKIFSEVHNPHNLHFLLSFSRRKLWKTGLLHQNEGEKQGTEMSELIDNTSSSAQNTGCSLGCQ
jgi:hypothetical protein